MAVVPPLPGPPNRERDDTTVQHQRPNPAAAAASAAANASSGAQTAHTTATAGEVAENDPATQRRRIAMIIASIKEQCEADVNLEDELNEEEDQTFTSIEASDWTTTRNEHLKKITDPAKKIVEVVPRASAESTPLTGRWVDSCGDDGVFKSRWTTHGFKQELNGTETHHSGTPATAHIKALLIDAALQGYVAALGDCSGAFYQAPLQERVWLEAPPEANLPEGYAWRALCAFPGLKGAPRAWEDHSANVLAQLGMDRSKYDGCVFWARPKATKAGKHVDDFVVTGPQEPVEELLKVMKDRPNLRDIIRLYREGDEGTLLSMNVRKIEGGYAVKGKDSLIVDAAEILHLEGANTVRTPENTNEKWGPEDDIPLGIGPHRDYRTCGEVVTPCEAQVGHSARRRSVEPEIEQADADGSKALEEDGTIPCRSPRGVP